MQRQPPDTAYRNQKTAMKAQSVAADEAILTAWAHH
jgi:hypothetical protein